VFQFREHFDHCPIYVAENIGAMFKWHQQAVQLRVRRVPNVLAF
jgi:S-formylglutathione hydrolase FrmB